MVFYLVKKDETFLGNFKQSEKSTICAQFFLSSIKEKNQRSEGESEA